jgi:uncharacterized protein (TIGR02118 family)
MDRRTSLSLAALALVATGATSRAVAAETTGKVKYTVLYGTPKDPDEFEKHYAEIHMPLVIAGGLPRFEASKCMPQADGSAPPFFRMFEAWFDSIEHMNAMFGTPAWAKVRADVPTFATGGVTRMVSKVA